MSALRSLLCSLTILALGVDARATPQGSATDTLADQFARMQDFSTSPPTIDAYLSHLLYYLEPNGSFEHLTGPPFPQPGPFYLFPGLWSYSGFCRTGTEVTSSSPRCIRKTTNCFVTLTFTDGSRYSFEDLSVTTTCDDGSSDSFQKRYHVAEVGPPGARDWIVRVESWTQETLETRKHYVRGRAGATASFQHRNGAAVVSGGPLEIDMAPGAVLDLTQNPAGNGPLFVTDGPTVLRCDTVLLDPGVVLADLFSPPPIVLPGAVVPEVGTPALQFAYAAQFPLHVDTSIYNVGNDDLVVQVTWSGAQTAAGQSTVNVPMAQRVRIPIQLAAPDTVLVQATPIGAPGAAVDGAMIVANGHAGVLRYGTGSAGCLGVHDVAIDGPVAVGGSAATITVTNNNPNGIGLWLFGEPVAGYGALYLPGPTELYVDAIAPWFVTDLYLCDAAGVGSFVFQPPADPSLRAVELVCQPLGLWLGPCNPGALSFSSGPALLLQVQ